NVGRPQRAEAEVDERAVALGELRGNGPGGVAAPDARLEVVPGLLERDRALVVEFLRIEIEVEPGGGVDQLARRQRRRAPLLAELVEVRVHAADRLCVLGTERLPLAPVVDRQARVGRRELGILQLEGVAGDDPYPRVAARRDRWEAAHVVLDNGVGLAL